MRGSRLWPGLIHSSRDVNVEEKRNSFFVFLLFCSLFLSFLSFSAGAGGGASRQEAFFSNFTAFLPSFTRVNRVRTSYTGFQRVSLGFT